MAVPPSPNATSLGIYGNVPVNYYNGTPSIILPLIEIASGELKHSISLNYNSTSNKVKDQASWVGLGWTLNAGGVITRKKRGLGDFVINSNGGVFSSPTELSPCLFDKERDMFYYSLDGYSGQFIIKTNGEVFPLQQTNLKIELVDQTGTGFKITTPDGIKYEFLTTEETFLDEIVNGFSPTFLITSSWYLTKITSPQGREIIFNYTSSSYPSIDTYETEELRTRMDLTLSCLGLNEEETWDEFEDYFTFGEDPHTDKWEISIVEAIYFNRYLQSIVFDEGKIEFITNDRNDLEIADQTKIPQALSQIRLLDPDGSIQYKYNFETGYFDSGGSAENHRKKRLKLESISKVSNEAIPWYSFEYIENVNLPDKTSISFDHWGYFNGAVNPSGTHLYDRIMSPNSIYSCANLISKIIYPTGGHSVFTWEGHSFESRLGYTSGAGNRIQKIVTSDGDENRIIKLQYLKSGTTAETSGKLISGVCHWFDSSIRGSIIKDIFIDGELEEFECDYYAWYSHDSSENFWDFTSLFQSNLVGYDRVVEILGEFGEGGKTEYIFHNESIELPTEPYDHWIPNEPKQPSPLNGKLISECYYAFENSEFQPRKLVEYEYNNVNALSMECEILDPTIRNYSSFSGISCSGGMNWVDYNLTSSWVALSKETQSDLYHDNSEVLTSRTYEYNSISHKLPTKVTLKDGYGEIKTEQIFRYPVDASNIDGLSNDNLQALANLAQQHRIGTIIEKEKHVEGALFSKERFNYKTDTNGWVYLEQVLQKSGNSVFENEVLFREYDTQKRVPIVYENREGILHSLKWDNYSNNIISITKNSNSGDNFYTDYEDDRETFTGYTTGSTYTLDTLLSMSGKSSMKISLPGSAEWSFFSRYLPISNTTARKYKYSCWVYSTGPSADLSLFWKPNRDENPYSQGWSNVSEDTDLTDKWVYLEGEVLVPSSAQSIYLRVDNNGGGNVWFDDIRLYPADAEMNTYTYKPLVGMTSHMDTNGRATHYEYDGFGRLKFIRDHGYNIIRRIEYNYKH